MTGLHHLAGRDETLHDFAADGSKYRNQRRTRGLRQVARVLDAENPHPLVSRVQVCLRLVAVRLGLLQVTLGDGVVLV